MLERADHKFRRRKLQNSLQSLVTPASDPAFL